MLILEENTETRSSFPYFCLIKGGCELIKLNLITYESLYLKFPSPIATLKEVEPSSMDFTGLLDLGGVFTYFNINLSYGDKFIQLGIWYDDINKSYLPKESILRYINLATARIRGRKESLAHLLHFLNHLVVVDSLDPSQVESNKSTYLSQEIVWYSRYINSYTGSLLLYKRDSKCLYILPSPLDINNKKEYQVIYESKELLKRVTTTSVNYSNLLIIVDEAKYFKTAVIYQEPNGEYLLSLGEEFYVHPYFNGILEFQFSEGWYFDSYNSVKLQLRGEEDEAVKNDKSPVS